MKKLLFIGIALSFYSVASCQSFVNNALLFSRTITGGSARIQALGGTQISLGGDYSSSLSNPSGLGMYNRSEFTLSPGYWSSATQGTFKGTSNNQTATSLNIPGLSYVFHHNNNSESGFLGGSLGVSFIRTNDLHSKYSYDGMNSNSSLIDYFKNDAFLYYTPSEMLYGGEDFNNLTALAFNNYLIDTVTINGQLDYASALDPLSNTTPPEIRTLRQQESIESSGAQNQWSISYGANFNDKLFIGAGLGITSLRYKLNVRFKESNFSYDQDTNYNPLDRYETDESYDIKGSGINFTVGLIYRPINFLQVGASIVTPTLYQVTDSYKASLASQWNNFDYYSDGSTVLNDVEESFDPLISEYSLKTPIKFSTGATFISKIGFISADIEMVNYAKAKYSSNTQDVSFAYDNEGILSTYTSVINYRVGAEGRYDIFRIRAGYRHMADPFANADINRSINAFSGGLGIKKEDFFIDFAATFSQSKDTRIPYRALNDEPVAALNIKTMNYILTLGFTF